MPGLFDYVNAINDTKHDLIRNEGDKDYEPFIVNKAMSYFPDTIFDAQMMNVYGLSKQMQFDYYRLAVKKKKRYSKWGKKTQSDFIQAVAETFELSYTKALDVLNILNPKQRDELAAYMNKGGTTK